jgi:hypothetical protein
MPLVRSALLSSVILFASCNSKVTSGGDPALQKQIQTITDCFPDLFPKAEGLLDLAELWRMNTNGSIPDPAGLTHSGSGPITAGFTFDGCALSMTIRFYDPDGNEQTGLPLSATSLADRIDEAATSLRNSFPTGKPFMVGDWTLTGGGASGSGALTGIIGGSTNGNELEELRTTETTPAGGPPALATSTVREGDCTLTFRTDSLVTDSFPTQQYPIGTMTITIDGDDADSLADVTATVTFDNTAVVKITLDGTVSGRFEFNVETRGFTSVP